MEINNPYLKKNGSAFLEENVLDKRNASMQPEHMGFLIGVHVTT